MNIFKRMFDAVLFLFTYLRKNAFCRHRPLSVRIEPTNVCNLSCIMCPYTKMTRKKGYMSLELFKKLIDNNYTFIRHLDLYMLGEPLLHGQIDQMVEYARKYNVWTRMYTNAVFLDEKISKKLILSGLNAITISLDGLNKTGYQEIRKSASFEKIIENIRKFIIIKNDLKMNSPHVSVKFVNFRFDRKKIKLFVKKIKSMGVDSVDGMIVHGWPGFKFSYNDAVGKKINKNKYYHCVMPWSVISIGWDGKVYGCCDDYDGLYVIGNIDDTPHLKDIWNSEKMIVLRRKLAKGDYHNLPHCKDCDRLWRPPLYNTIFKNAYWSLQESL